MTESNMEKIERLLKTGHILSSDNIDGTPVYTGRILNQTGYSSKVCLVYTPDESVLFFNTGRFDTGCFPVFDTYKYDNKIKCSSPTITIVHLIRANPDLLNDLPDDACVTIHPREGSFRIKEEKKKTLLSPSFFKGLHSHIRENY